MISNASAIMTIIRSVLVRQRYISSIMCLLHLNKSFCVLCGKITPLKLYGLSKECSHHHHHQPRLKWSHTFSHLPHSWFTVVPQRICSMIVQPKEKQNYKVFFIQEQHRSTRAGPFCLASYNKQRMLGKHIPLHPVY